MSRWSGCSDRLSRTQSLRETPICDILDAMALSIQKFREIVFQLLYSRDFKIDDIEGMVPMLMRQLTVPKRAAASAQQRAGEIWEKRQELDQKINANIEGYEEDRVLRVERAILRLGAYELLEKAVPPKVAISEATRLARKFATKESSAFVNAVLDSIFTSSEHETLSKEPAPL